MSEFSRSTEPTSSPQSGSPVELGASAGEQLSGSDRKSAEYHAALDFLYGRLNYERLASVTSRYPFRLHRTAELLERLGMGRYLATDTSGTTTPPQAFVPLVHIAGTKGKGSTAAMVSELLSASGYRTGLYTSPHLAHLEERFRIDGRPCQPTELLDLVNVVRPLADSMTAATSVPPSFFELTTAMALLHFDRRECQAIVIEVGLGGRLDSTNVVRPSVTAVTSVGLDHQHVLGDTLAEIAAEKAGIAKSGVPLVSGVRPSRQCSDDTTDPARPVLDDPAEVVERIATQHNAPCYRIGRDFDVHASPSEEWGTAVQYTALQPPFQSRLQSLSLDGAHQGHNLAIALAITDLLSAQGVKVDRSAADQRLANLRFAARIERIELHGGVTAILDAAHNDDSIAALCATIDRRFQDRTIAIVFGTSRDKSARSMLVELGARANGLFLTRFRGNPRFVAPAELATLVPSSTSGHLQTDEDPVEACRAARKFVGPGGVIVVCGSFFLASETRGWLLDQSMGSPLRSAPASP